MSDSEDDYMKMAFPDHPTNSQPETSLQRRQRERREAEARGRVKSKAELAAEAEARREAALSRSLLESATPTASGKSAVPSAKASKGLAMMAKMGFKGGALGKQREEGAADDRVVEPIRISVKDGREGIGLESERKRKLREAAEAAEEQVKKVRVDEGEYRDRVRRGREEVHLERQVAAAQKVAERMDDGEMDIATRPLRSVPLVYRPLVRMRAEAERERRMRKDLELSLPRLPTYDDPDEDEDDKRALGRGQVEAATTYLAADDLDEEDNELEEFNALPPEDRLQRLVAYLRVEHRYCFWCKFAYPDVEMEGCPGLTEEDHD